MSIRILLVTFSVVLLYCPSDSLAQLTQVESQFVRFVPGADTWEGELQTAITSYRNADGVTLDLVAAIHIGDRSYYQRLNDYFLTQDVVLYEMVADVDDRPALDTAATSLSPLSFMQRALANFLQVSFQLEHIDYSSKIFRHADLSPLQLREIMQEKNENFFSMFLSLALAQMASEQASLANGGPPTSFTMLSVMNALMAEDRSTAFKYLFAEELGRSNGVMVGAGLEQQLTLLGDRNSVALEVLADSLTDDSLKQISIFYGAAHMPGLEREIVQSHGFVKTGQRWMRAWRIR
jgi:hypothetical protein